MVNHKISTIVLLGILFIFTIAIVAGSVDVFHDEAIPNTITQINTAQAVCFGGNCYPGWELSIEHNASIAGSPVCTMATGCTIGGAGTPGTGVIIETAECDGTCSTITETVYE